ncbi:ankyrin-3-like [Saccostrea echinata]|uniref:ankyrin-3-like n=1 Tax=Saccostrea echinata TaxID=191078 RepID=UPI002A7FDCD7|nr:ankyrin-3-like [Saccostrea echinata]
MPRCGCGHYMSSADSDTEEAEDRSESRWLNHWAEEDQKFVPTRASRLVESKLYLNKIVLLGGAGCGKSAIAKHIALKFWRKDWQIVEARNLNDIKKAEVKTESVLFVINDPIGKSDLDEKSCRMWHLQKHILDEYFSINKEEKSKVKLPKIIVTCRSNLLQKEMEFLMNGFTIINLDGDDARLTEKEKEDILKKHIDCLKLKGSEINQLIKTENSIPLISSTVSNNKKFQEDVLNFFREPFEQLKREILLLKENSKEKYLCLLLLILHGNKLSKHSFDDEEQESESLENQNDEDSDIEKIDNENENICQEEEDDDDSKNKECKEDKECSDDDDDDSDDEGDDDDEDDDDDDNFDDYENSHFDEDIDDIDDRILNDLLTTFNLPQNTSKIALYQYLKSLRGHYFVRRVNKTFKITDDSFLLALTSIFCTDVPDQFLKYCKSSFYRTLTTSSIKQNEVFPRIQLKDRFIDPFVERIEEDIKNGTYLDIFLSPWIQDERVLTKLQIRLKTKSKDEIEKVLLCSKLNQYDCLPVLGPVLQRKLRGFSRFDLIPLCHEISPIILALVLNIENLFLAIFALVREKRTFSEYLKNSPMISAICVNGRTDFVAQIMEMTDFRNACWSKQENIYAVHIAANFLHTDILSLILNGECDVNIVTKNYESPLFLAAAADRYTLQNIPWTWNKECSKFDENVDEMLEEKRMRILTLLVQKGADVNIHPVKFPSALAYSCQRKNKEIVEILLESGANVNDTGEEQMSALHFASKVGSLDIVKLLLDKGADVHMKTTRRLSPLYFASLKGYETVVELLLSKGTGDELKEKTGYSPFFTACKNGHTNIVKMFLQHNPCINCTLISGTTAFFAAVDNGHEKIVEMLIKNGADVNVVRKNNIISPLYSAAARGYVSILEALLNCGLDINLKTKQGDTPLIVASQNGHYSTVQLLLKNKANVNQANDFLKAPLHFAAEKGHKNVVQELVNHGAEINMSNKQGATALFLASEHGHVEVVKILLVNKADVNSCTKYGKSPLFIASEFGHHEIVQELLSQGAKDKEDSSRNPLLAPLYSGYDKTVALLAENGANINEKNDEGRSPLMNASRRGWTDVVKILLKNGADTSCKDEEDENALDMASFRGHSDIVKLLLDHGMDINNNGYDESYTPLQQALKGNRLSTALLLLERGADVHTIVYGITALFLACSAGFKEVVDILLESKAEVNPKDSDGPTAETLLMKAIEKNQAGIVKLLIEYGANINSEDNDGNTALHASAYYNSNAECMSVLLNNKADVNVCNQKGTTPMMMALQKLFITKEMIQTLVDHGADVNARDNDGEHVLHYAAMYSEGFFVLPLLLEHGADVNIRNEYGRTALHESCYHGCLKAVKVLLKYGADVSIRSEDGLTALDIANRGGYKKVIKILSEKLIESRVEKDGSIPSSSLKSYSPTLSKDVVLVRKNSLGPALPRKRAFVKVKKTWR